MQLQPGVQLFFFPFSIGNSGVATGILMVEQQRTSPAAVQSSLESASSSLHRHIIICVYGRSYIFSEILCHRTYSLAVADDLAWSCLRVEKII